METCRHYIGLDAHSKHSYFVMMDRLGRIRKRQKVQTQESALLDVLSALPGKKALAFEETSVSQWLYVLLKDEVSHLVVCDPAANPKTSGAKTDFIDATELADLLRVNRLKPVFHSADPVIRIRVLVSGYLDVTQELTRAKNRYKALFRQVGEPASGAGFYVDAKRAATLPDATQRFVATRLHKQIVLLEKQKASYQKQFQQNLRRYPPARLLESIPGIGPVRANILLAVVVTPYRFPTKYKFFSYSSLVWHPRMSDGRRYGRTKSRGNDQLRGLFHSAAHLVIRCDNAFRRQYERKLAEGADRKAAKNAIARSLAATVLGVWKSGRRYDDKYREVRHRKVSSKRG